MHRSSGEHLGNTTLFLLLRTLLLLDPSFFHPSSTTSKIHPSPIEAPNHPANNTQTHNQVRFHKINQNSIETKYKRWKNPQTHERTRINTKTPQCMITHEHYMI